MVVAPEHPIVGQITTDAQRAEVEAYVDATSRRSERDRQASAAEGDKTGAFTGAHAINPVNGEKIPIWISDYVLMGYGTGAIMAVPGHDTRDHAFAKTFGLPIVEVVSGGSGPIEEEAFPGEGVAVNSGVIDGLKTPEAKAKIIAHLEEQGTGHARVTYKLRDWLFSRQRYWGEPFPLVHRPDGEVAAVPEGELPVELPPMEDFNPSESGDPPLAKAEQWRELPDGSLRETNTMPQWAGSCWYYLRYLDPHDEDRPWSKESEAYWMPVDLYVGGAEHAVLHLLYARFWHKVLYDLGHVSTPEPFGKLVHQGMVLGATYVPKDPARKTEVFRPEQVEQVGDDWFVKGTDGPKVAVDLQWDKMSKSRGNVVNPDDVINEHGADTMRLYEMFMGPLEHSAPWDPQGVTGCHKFLQRAYRLFFESAKGDDEATPDRPRKLAPGEGTDRQRRLLHQTIEAVTERVERMGFNTAISAMMVFVRDIEKDGEALAHDAACQFCLLLAPFAPHLAEECWRALGYADTLAYEPWPAADPEFLQDETWTLVLQVNGKRRAELQIPASVDPKAKDEVLAMAHAHEAVVRHVGDKEPKRVIYVPGKLVNIVV
jgi:leucyl-tRNA synthetase